MKKSAMGIVLSVLCIALYAGIAAAAETSPLANAIAKQLETAPQSIDMQAASGYLGIPGGPQTNMLLAFGWALWVGWIFSTVGAFGGVMAGVGHMSVHGLGAYAKSFGQTPLNKSITAHCHSIVCKSFSIVWFAVISTCKCHISLCNRQRSVFNFKFYICKVLTYICKIRSFQIHRISSCIGSFCLCLAAKCKVIRCI